MTVVSMKALLEAGVHFGHRSQRWHPKMRPVIFTERNGIHIIDLQQTMTRLEEAYNFIRDQAAEGGTVLFVGTKKQAQETIASEAQRCGMPYVNQRWLGGTLTNFRTIRQRADYLLELEAQKARGEFEILPKKEALWKERELSKLQRRLGGLKNMYYLPSALFVTDVRREATAIKEANTLGIPVVAMVDTNCDPDPIDYVIPANDDAIRAIRLITSLIANAVIEGQGMRGVIMAEEGVEVEEAPVSVEGLPRVFSPEEGTEEEVPISVEGLPRVFSPEPDEEVDPADKEQAEKERSSLA